MDTKMMEQFEIMDTDMLTCVEGGGCNWGDFAKAGVGGGVARGLRLGIKTRTWQGAAAGAAGGAILGGVAYAATCWW